MTNKRHSTSPDSIHEALAVLDRAARHKRAELSEVLETEYQDFKKVLGGVSSGFKQKTDAFKQKTNSAWQAGQKKIENSVSGARTQLSHVNETVHEKPWNFMAGAALSAFLLGFGVSKRFK